MRSIMLSLEFIIWLPRIFWSVACLSSAILYFRRDKISLPKLMRWMILAALIFYAGYALLLTFAQYDLWSRNQFTHVFIESPLPSAAPFPEYLKNLAIFKSNLGYFVFYSFSRFWLRAVLSIFSAFVFYGFLRSLRKYRDRLFEESETELGLLSALIAGWPGIIVFLLLVFPGVVLASLFRRIFFKKELTTLGWSFIFAGFVSFWWGEVVLVGLGLRVLFI